MNPLQTIPLSQTAFAPVASLLNAAFETGRDGEQEWLALIEREVDSGRVDPECSTVVQAGESVIGACLVNVGWNSRARIGPTGVHPSARRQGVGRRLVSRCLERLGGRGAKEVVLEVSPDNQAAIAMYCEQGFVDKRGLSTWMLRRSELASPTDSLKPLVISAELAVRVANSFDRPSPAFQRSAPYVSSFGDGVRALGLKRDSQWAGVLVQRGRDLLDLALHPQHLDDLGTLIWAATELSWEIRLMHQVDEDPLCEVLTRVGFRMESRAREMVKVTA